MSGRCGAAAGARRASKPLNRRGGGLGHALEARGRQPTATVELCEGLGLVRAHISKRTQGTVGINDTDGQKPAHTVLGGRWASIGDRRRHTCASQSLKVPELSPANPRQVRP